ncbi:MAG: hypothetical protein WCT07_00095 [Candidatus Paceibacterota bacterium]|jgi:hypothetical protein
MKQNIKISLGSAILIILVIISFYYYQKETQTQTEIGNVATTTEKTSTTTTPVKKPTAINETVGFHSYVNTEYNFSIKYPPYVQVRPGFSTFHEIGNNWRLYAGQFNQGKPLVSLSIYSIDQGQYSTGHQDYPLYFTSEVRIGVSPNVKECYTSDSSFPNQKVTNVIINGVTFKRFSTVETSGTKYTSSESYRIIHNNNCYAIEQIKSGTNYRDSLMSPGVADSALTNYYNTGETIVKTFRFTK